MEVCEIKECSNIISLFEIVNDGESLLRFEINGDIYVKGKLIENDKEVVNAFREYFKIGL